ncbi:MAG: hypothetical protein NC541_07305 [bacterium]|nr:hypothetical protein [bacterium]
MAVNLMYHPGLYLGESIPVKKLDKIKRKLENRPLFAGVFLIALSRNPRDQLEIYEAGQLAQRYYMNNPPYIVGIAGDYNEAVGLVERLVQECLRERGDCALKEYLLCGT